MSNLDIPPQVTRFYGRTEYALDVLENKRITFVHISQLNDPFDPYCFFETDFDANYVKLIEHVKKQHPGNEGWLRAHVTPKSWGNTVRDLRELLAKVRASSFVFSTSAPLPERHPKDNLYMWGHYGSGHRGVAIEYETAALTQAVWAHHKAINSEPSTEKDVWAKIEYSKTFGPITVEDVYEFLKQERDIYTGRIATRNVTGLDRYYNRMTTIKSDAWRNENEWRLMWRNEETAQSIYHCPIADNCVKAIYLGLAINAADVAAVISAVRRNFATVPILQSTKKHGELALSFMPI